MQKKYPDRLFDQIQGYEFSIIYIHSFIILETDCISLMEWQFLF